MLGKRETFTFNLNNCFIRDGFKKETVGTDGVGGFFKEVFGDDYILSKYRSYPELKKNDKSFGNDIKGYLCNGYILGLVYTTPRAGTHIETLWGAEYDESGNIKSVYLSDSDDQNEGTAVGMKRKEIRLMEGQSPKLSTNRSDLNAGSRITAIEILRLGQDKWQEYFANNPD